MNRKTGVLLSYALMAVEICSTLLFTPFFIRTLGQSEYGIYQLISSVTSYLVLLDLGVGSSVVRYMAKYRADKDLSSQKKFLGVAVGYYLCVAVFSLAVGAVLIYALPHLFSKGLTESEISLGRKLLSMTVLSTAISLAASGFSNALIAYERFTVSKGTSILFTVLRILVSVMVLKAGFGSVGVVAVNLAVTVFTRAIYVVYVVARLKIRPSFKNIDLSFIKEIVGFSSFVLLQMIASQINAMSDQVLLAAFTKGASVIIGIYGVGAQILQYFKTIGSHFTSVLMPGLVRMVERKATAKELENEMIRVGRIIFMVLSLVWTVFLVFGQDFIILWAGAENAKAYIVAVTLMFPAMLSYTEGVGYQLLWALGKHKQPAVIQVISAVLNIALTIVLILWKPLEGAVIGSFVALFFCEAVLMTIMYKKQIGIHLTSYFKGLFKGIVPSLLLTVVVGLLFKQLGFAEYGWGGFFVNCISMTAVYGLSMLLFGMNKYEKNLIFNPLKKVLKKLGVK